MSAATVTGLRTVTDRRTWAALAAQAVGATFFHSWEWAECVSREFGWRPHRHVIDTPRGRWLCQSFQTSRGLESGPIGYGGPLPLSDAAEADHPEAVLAAVEEAVGTRFTRIVCSPDLELTLNRAGGREQRTSIVRPARSWDLTWSSVLTGNARTAVRACRHNGVTVTMVRDAAEVNSVYDIYDESMERVGATYRTPPALLRALVSLGDDHVWFLRADCQGRPIGIGMFFRHSHHLFHWIGAYRSADRHLMSTHAILGAAVKEAVERGTTVIDLGASMTEGQLFAKSRWGAVERPYQVYEEATS
ncbi:GNAT family N-acetyltransferase [Micromonospora sp. WMMD980]|uniref:GNAT family N-acetyltransferase n=1 Tax=Micromonospora sp. WMMD980 TaxID=3016088 RepID=UPI0024178548|nr:GNAT family N-acetyltransferase [Micromonospora sp. WMMD980]MDG4803230.1 GNAT family N-acetyltransferase [Micromonospora sp. WMMD980]